MIRPIYMAEHPGAGLHASIAFVDEKYLLLQYRNRLNGNHR